MTKSTPHLNEMGKRAKKAFQTFSLSDTEEKNRILHSLADQLETNRDVILKANQYDIEEAKKNNLEESLIDRLRIDKYFSGIVADIRHVAKLPDPIGTTLEERTLPNGLKLQKIRTPLGVIGVIYESRPNVTIDVASLVIKTGNCAILRGGSETIETNKALMKVIRDNFEACGVTTDVIQFIDSRDRKLVTEMLTMSDTIDLIIPRGGAGLHKFCRENSRIPVITGGIGICHLFVDESADLAKSLDVIENAKTQRPTVCNALDTLLVHESIAKEFIPQIIEKLTPLGVTFKLSAKTSTLTSTNDHCQSADEGDWDTEWLGLTLGIKVVSDMFDAIHHIREHSSGHSDGILTNDKGHAKTFIQHVDSSSVYVNASTRFTDGAQFGLGAEVAISTQKLHARGPMGPDELTTYKWVVEGNYHTRP